MELLRFQLWLMQEIQYSIFRTDFTVNFTRPDGDESETNDASELVPDGEDWVLLVRHTNR